MANAVSVRLFRQGKKIADATLRPRRKIRVWQANRYGASMPTSLPVLYDTRMKIKDTIPRQRRYRGRGKKGLWGIRIKNTAWTVNFIGGRSGKSLRVAATPVGSKSMQTVSPRHGGFVGAPRERNNSI